MGSPVGALSQPLVVRFWKSYATQRTIHAFFKVYIVTTAIFFLIRLMPASPVEVYINQLISQYGVPYQEAQNMAAALFSLDLDKPLVVQYIDYLTNLLRGDLGVSLVSRGTPVIEMIGRFLPWTLFSVGLATVASFGVGMLLGMAMAYRRGSLLDTALTTFASVMTSIPNYLVAILILVFAGVQWNLVSIHAMRGSLSPGVTPGFTWTFFKDALYHAALPMFTYFITTVGQWMLSMKSSTMSTLEEDYVTVARARGLPDRRIVLAYVGRNASLPLFTQLALQIGFAAGAGLLIETFFVYQGVGKLLIDSINARDYTVMQGCFLIITVMVIFANLLADLLYGRLDPRIRIQGGRS